MRARSRIPRSPAALRSLLLGSLIPLAVFWTAGPLTAQQVRFVPRPDREEERRLARFVEEGSYELWVRDTVLSNGDSIPGGVLILEAAVRIEGSVGGSVYVVDGDLFLRPGARIEGDVVVLGGGYYSSQLARVEGTVVYRPDLFLSVVPRGGGYEIFAEAEEPRAITLHGLYGFGFPSYQRVDEWTLSWGGTLRATGLAWQPTLEATARFRTEQAEPEATLRALWHPTGSLRFGAVAERATVTEDGWIRGDVANSVTYLLGSGDFRNYFRADRAALVVERTVEAGWAPSLRVGWEEASSLRARPQPVLFADDEEVRPNPAVDEGVTWSATAEVTLRRRAPGERLLVSIRAEGADSTVAGDFSFLLGEVRLAWSRSITRIGHAELLAVGRGDLAGRLPRQRWSAVGGENTLPTLSTLSRRGERLLYGQIGYYVPLEPLRVPHLGAPEVFVRGALGAAWSEPRPDLSSGSGPSDPVFEENVMLGVRFLLMEALVAVEPTEGEVDPEFVLSAAFPRPFWR